MKKLSKLISQSVYCILSASMVGQIQPNEADLDISMPDCELESNMLFLDKSLQRRNKQRWESSEMDKHQFSYSANPIIISGETTDVKSGINEEWIIFMLYMSWCSFQQAILESLLIFAFWFAFSLYFQMFCHLPGFSLQAFTRDQQRKKKISNPKEALLFSHMVDRRS